MKKLKNKLKYYLTDFWQGENVLRKMYKINTCTGGCLNDQESINLQFQIHQRLESPHQKNKSLHRRNKYRQIQHTWNTGTADLVQLFKQRPHRICTITWHTEPLLWSTTGVSWKQGWRDNIVLFYKYGILVWF